MQVLTALDDARIADLRRRGEFFWLDLLAPSDADLRHVGELFGVHELALEDMSHFGQRPKLDTYGDHVLLVYYGARPEDRYDPRLIEVQLIISGDFIVSVRQDACAELDGLRARFERGQGGSEQFVVYRVIDALTDSFFPVLEGIDDEIDELEQQVVLAPTDEQLQRIFRLKRALVAMRRVITPQRDLFAREADEIIDLPGLEAGTRDYFRDVYDHLIRISDLVDSYRDVLSGAMDVYLSTVSNRLNAVMKQLTIIATVFLPLTVVTGFFGQNFGWLTGHIDSFAAFLGYGIGGLVVPCVILFAWFRRAGYL